VPSLLQGQEIVHFSLFFPRFNLYSVGQIVQEENVDGSYLSDC
jgi:hypothetical protein